ncbi:hypothetical protein ACEZDB_37300 [Streptacidiphilus sp. N1-3]|uniref:Uncharacterized protein n=1 Tax=Streptacidiphilus alkalitolerans TaxID=3342712 RepID=A0ABV6XDN8_9ACTN
MDESGRGAFALAVALQDAHVRLRRVVKRWEALAPAGSVARCEALGPVWQSSDHVRPGYFDGQALVLARGGAVSCELSIQFGAQGPDFTVRASLESEDGEDGMELLTAGPPEFPSGADDLVAELSGCLERLEQLDVSEALGAEA